MFIQKNFCKQITNTINCNFLLLKQFGLNAFNNIFVPLFFIFKFYVYNAIKKYQFNIHQSISVICNVKYWVIRIMLTWTMYEKTDKSSVFILRLIFLAFFSDLFYSLFILYKKNKRVILFYAHWYNSTLSFCVLFCQIIEIYIW